MLNSVVATPRASINPKANPLRRASPGRARRNKKTPISTTMTPPAMSWAN